MRSGRIKSRSTLLVLVEAILIFGGIVVAVYLRLDADDVRYELIERHRALQNHTGDGDLPQRILPLRPV
ncbi:MAG: hypothetical protein WKF84_16870 [Pyrinomonadaceae bacterium]